MQVWNTTDAAKVESLVESMINNGWVGAPLVKLNDELLLTGSHRYEASKEAGINAPMITIQDVFAEAGIDYDAQITADLADEDGCFYTDERDVARV